MSCIFCKIVNGEIPAKKIFENEHAIAFLDISQVTKGHTLVIPKKHVKDLFELDPKDAKEIFEVVSKVAKQIDSTYKPLGLNLINNNREFAGQTVFHLHFHLIPRYNEEDGFNVIWSPNPNHDLDLILDELKINNI